MLDAYFSLFTQNEELGKQILGFSRSNFLYTKVSNQLRDAINNPVDLIGIHKLLLIDCSTFVQLHPLFIMEILNSHRLITIPLLFAQGPEFQVPIGFTAISTTFEPKEVYRESLRIFQNITTSPELIHEYRVRSERSLGLRKT